MADVFISYHEDSAGELAEQIADALAAAGISCWYAKRDMPIGGDFARNIPPQINACRLFLLLLNDGVYQSRHIENEVGLAFSRLNKGENILILPLEIGNFIRKDWVAYYLIHTQSLKIALLDSVNQQELTRKIAESLGVTPKKTNPTPQGTPQPSEPETPQPPARRNLPRFHLHGVGLLLVIFALLLFGTLLFLFLYHPTWTLYDHTLTISSEGEMDYGYKLPRLLLFDLNLSRLSFSDSPPWARHSATITEVVIEPGVTSIRHGAFFNFSRLERVTIPDSVTSIKNSAFTGCSRLTAVTIPPGITEISAWSFAGCSRLTAVIIPPGVTTIGEAAFHNCTSLTDIEIPDSVTAFAWWAFHGCTSLTDIKIPDSVTIIGECAFYECTSLTSVEIPVGVTTIGEAAFHRCTSLTSVTIPNSVTRIGGSAFLECTSLTSVEIPDSVVGIGRGAFADCTNLTEASVPEGLDITDVFPENTTITRRAAPEPEAETPTNPVGDVNEMKRFSSRFTPSATPKYVP